MDSITHIALGAAIGEARLGREIGYKAAVWGAVISTLPDLDVLLYPFLDSASQLQIHRGITHSFFFMFVGAPLFGWLIDLIHKKDGVGWKSWTLLCFFTLLSHLLIDLPTSYGTQILEPFSDHRFTTDSIFIIDPLLTAPLIAGVILALVQNRNSQLRYWASRAGILAGAFYLITGMAVKTHVNRVYSTSFQEQYGEFDRLKTIPGPFTTLLWTGYMERSDSIYVGTYSLFDKDERIHFRGVAKNSHLIEPWKEDHPVQVLLWFSMGYYKIDQAGDEIFLHDLRFGRNDFWLTDVNDYVWTNRLIFNPEGTEVLDFDRAIPLLDTELDNHQLIWRRFWGVEFPVPTDP